MNTHHIERRIRDLEDTIARIAALEWVDRPGAAVADEDAPPADVLKALERDGLIEIHDVSMFDEIAARFSITGLGAYELQRRSR